MKYIYIGTICLFLSAAGLKAQKVETSGSGETQRVFINCNDLPMIGQCPASIAQSEMMEQKWTINSDKQYTLPAKRFEISRYNSNYLTQSWTHSDPVCKNLKENGENWRLPNQRELLLIFVLRPALESKTGFTAFQNGYYMSGLVSTKTGSSPFPQTQVDLSNGNSKSSGAEEGYYIRCVRDIIE